MPQMRKGSDRLEMPENILSSEDKIEEVFADYGNKNEEASSYWSEVADGLTAWGEKKFGERVGKYPMAYDLYMNYSEEERQQAMTDKQELLHPTEHNIPITKGRKIVQDDLDSFIAAQKDIEAGTLGRRREWTPSEILPGDYKKPAQGSIKTYDRSYMDKHR